MRKLSLPALAVLLLAVPASAQITRGGALPGPLPLFRPSNWWNTDVSRAPVDPQSATFINFIGPAKGMHPDFGGDDPDNPPAIYGMVYIAVPGTQPLEQVFFYESPGESDNGAPGRPSGYPIPVDAKTQTKWIEGGLAANDPAASGDRHMLIVDRDNRILFELYATLYNSTLNRWEAASGAIFPLDSNVPRPDTWTSADAAGLAILPGLVRYDEAFGTDPIRHAFRVTVRATNGYVFPGSHEAGSTAGALPMGARLRLKASKDISAYTPELQRIFQAMKTYGLIVADNGTDMYISGAYDTRWDNGVLNPAFGALKASDFEVVRLGWRPELPRGDFSGDVREDILLRDGASGDLGMWVMNGPAIAGGGFVGPAGTYEVAATADFDGDGKSDILLRDAAGNIGMWRMSGSTVLSGAFVGSPGGYTVAGAADFDGDNRADILLRDGSGNLGLWLMQGSTIAAGAFVGSPGSYTVAGVADFNGDRRADILLRDSLGNLGMWLMDGSAIASGAFVGSPGGYSVAATADFTGDGIADILLRDGTGNLGMWIMNGPAIAAGALVGSPGSYTVVKARDFDGDQRADILLRHEGTGELGMWLMNGAAIAGGGAVGSPGAGFTAY